MVSEASDAVIAAAAQRVLTAGGPLSEGDLLRTLRAEGVALGSDPEERLADALDADEALVLPLADGRWASLPGLLDGRTFTHRLTEVEVRHDLILVGPDVAPFSMLTGSEVYQRLTDGTFVVDVFPFLDADVLAGRGISEQDVGVEGALLFEPGRLARAGVTAGDLVGFRVTAAGLELTAVDTPGACAVAPAIAELVAARPEAPQLLDLAVWSVCATDDSLFREPAAPLGELLTEGGLAVHGDWVAARGFDFAGWQVRGRIDSIAETHDLSDDEALAVLATVRLYEQTAELVEAALLAQQSGDEQELAGLMAQLPTSSGPPSTETRRPSGRSAADRGGADAATVRATLEFLAEPAVAAAVLAETVSERDGALAALGVFAESVEPMAPRAARPALRWLRAKAYELIGDVDTAERTYRAAEALDPSWPLTLVALARYAGDRGDAERGLALLRRAGAPRDDQLVQVLERFAPAPRAGLGRNQPCWCGSGRKYKVCHLHREQLPLAERAAWLYLKATVDLLDGPFGGVFFDAAQARAAHWDASDALVQALEDGLVADVVLVEGGAFAEFVAVRGSLLPDDERSLAEQWLLSERSVHEVTAVRRGEGLTMRDVRTGDVHDVRERVGSRNVEVGRLYCARVVPAGDTMQIFGGLEPVDVGTDQALLALLDDEPDPVEIVEFLSRRFAPPSLHNTEGEPMTLCDATLRVADPAALTAALDHEFDRSDDGPDGALMWFEHVITHGMQRIRAHVELRGESVHVHANSEPRFERALTAVRALDPSITLIDQTRVPASDVRDLERLTRDGTPTPPQVLDPATDPDVATALEQLVRRHEAAWLDESIPALAGRTPRECAGDPTRRPDLIRLLDSFPQDDSRLGTMSPARLRAALGLG